MKNRGRGGEGEGEEGDRGEGDGGEGDRGEGDGGEGDTWYEKHVSLHLNPSVQNSNETEYSYSVYSFCTFS